MNLSINSATIALNAVLASLNGGSITLYTGTMPASPETALSGNIALIAFAFANPAFLAPTFASGVNSAAASIVVATQTPVSSGTATFARATSISSTVVADFTVGLSGSGADIILAATSLSTSLPVTISNFAVQVPCS